MAVRITVLLAGCLGLHCAVALAQWDPGFTASLGNGLGSIALSQSVLSGTRLIGPLSAPRAGGAPAAPPAPRALTPEAATAFYFTDPRISDRVRNAMIDALSRQNPALRAQMERAFANGAVLQSFDRFMRSHGWYSHDLADDTAMLLLVGWGVATGHDATDAQIQGARQQVHGVFVQTPQLRAMTNADRQEMGERIAYQVVIILLNRQECMRNGDQAQLAQLRQSAATVLKGQGVDVTHLELTDQGFRPAS